MKRSILIVAMLLIGLSSFSSNAEPFALRENGSIPVWIICGPLPIDPPLDPGQTAAGGFYKDFLNMDGGENSFIPTENAVLKFSPNDETAWKASISDSDGVLDFLQALNSNMTEQGVAYAFCQLIAEKEQNVLLKIRSNDGVRVWVNQELVHDHHVGRKLDQEEDMVHATLKKGRNRLLVKVDQMGGGWGLCVQVVRPDRKPVQGITSSVTLTNPLKGKLSKVEFSPENLVVRTPEGNRQIIRAGIVSGGIDNLICVATSESWEKPITTELGAMPFGNHVFEFSVPPTMKPVHITLRTPVEEKTYPNIEIKPAREWTVYLVQHVHTDIGYTRPQTEILPEHLRYIDYALDYCDLTDHYPDDAKFRWTCEVSWAVREYLKRRPPEQIQRLKQRMKEGRIEAAGMFLNMSDIASESTLAASLQPIRFINEKLGIPIHSAMQNDVNGAAWCLVDYFSSIGIDYLTMGINKTRSLLPFDCPTVFWWESPSGKRIMAFRADHYHTPNLWKIHEGNIEYFKQGLLGHMKFLEANGYPFDRIAINFSGYHTDNSPPATIECDLVKEWNERYVWPKLKLATAHEFAEYIKENHADDLPVYRMAWPDWWTDGFGSAARETAEARTTQAEMQVTDSLLAMAKLSGSAVPGETMKREKAVQDNLLFYDEHTYGAAESISDPMAENSMVQWGEKSSYVWEAVKSEGLLREEAWGLLQSHLPREEVSTIAVCNTLNWKRSGLVEVFIDHEILPRDKDFRIVDPTNGENIPVQLMRSRSEGSYWSLWVKDIPALGYKIYRIEVDDRPRNPTPGLSDSQNQLENEYFLLKIHPQTGAISRLIDKQTGENIVDSDAEWQLGQLIYETLDKGRDFHLGAFHRRTVGNVKIHPSANGPIWKSYVIDAELAGSERVRAEIRLHNRQKQITLHYLIRKKPITQAEAVYVAFPFNRPGAQILYEAQGGMVEPGKNQIPRTASDWQGIQDFITVRSDEGQLVFASPQVPLVQLGDLNLGKWQEQTVIEKPYIYSWVMNNYWFTNFRASQEGDYRWDYTLAFTPKKDMSDAVRLGWNASIPLVARVFPAGIQTSDKKKFVSLLQLNDPNLLLVDARPSRYDDGIVLHLREVNGEKTLFDLKDISKAAGIRRWDEVSVIETPIQKRLRRLEFKPYEAKFIKLHVR